VSEHKSFCPACETQHDPSERCRADLLMGADLRRQDKHCPVTSALGDPCILTRHHVENHVYQQTVRTAKSEADRLGGINHPAHYGGDTLYEHVKVAEALGWVGNAFLYNATKYLWRLGKKGNPLVDLRKAIWYLRREDQRLMVEQGNRQNTACPIKDCDKTYPHLHPPELFSREATCVELGCDNSVELECDNISAPPKHSPYCQHYTKP